MPNYPMYKQKSIPHACCALHNFIRDEDRADTFFTLHGECDMDIPGPRFDIVNAGGRINLRDNSEMVRVRDEIANQLWEDYHRH